PRLVADRGLTGLLMNSRVAFASVLPGTTPGLPSPPHPTNDTTTATEPTAARTALIKSNLLGIVNTPLCRDSRVRGFTNAEPYAKPECGSRLSLALRMLGSDLDSYAQHRMKHKTGT